MAQDGTLTATSVNQKKDSDDVKFLINALQYIPNTSQQDEKRSLSSASSNVVAKKDEKAMAPQKAACAADSDKMSAEDNQLQTSCFRDMTKRTAANRPGVRCDAGRPSGS